MVERSDGGCLYASVLSPHLEENLLSHTCWLQARLGNAEPYRDRLAGGGKGSKKWMLKSDTRVRNQG
jgi:hypothetical protein